MLIVDRCHSLLEVQGSAQLLLLSFFEVMRLMMMRRWWWFDRCCCLHLAVVPSALSIESVPSSLPCRHIFSSCSSLISSPSLPITFRVLLFRSTFHLFVSPGGVGKVFWTFLPDATSVGVCSSWTLGLLLLSFLLGRNGWRICGCLNLRILALICNHHCFLFLRHFLFDLYFRGLFSVCCFLFWLFGGRT